MTATWTANATDAYSYAAGTGSGTAPAGGSGLDGTTIVLAANTFTEPGYTFAGWSDGNATYAAGATYTLASNGSAIVLDRHLDGQRHRRLLLRRGHRQRHRPGRGHGLDGTTIVLAANTFTEPGYTFAGWSDGNATYAAGATYTLASNGSAIVLDRHLDGQRHRRLLLRRGHRQRHRPGRGLRPRRHHHRLGRQHLHRAGLHLRRLV